MRPTYRKTSPCECGAGRIEALVRAEVDLPYRQVAWVCGAGHYFIHYDVPAVSLSWVREQVRAAGAGKKVEAVSYG